MHILMLLSYSLPTGSWHRRCTWSHLHITIWHNVLTFINFSIVYLSRIDTIEIMEHIILWIHYYLSLWLGLSIFYEADVWVWRTLREFNAFSGIFCTLFTRVNFWLKFHRLWSNLCILLWLWKVTSWRWTLVTVISNIINTW